MEGVEVGQLGVGAGRAPLAVRVALQLVLRAAHELVRRRAAAHALGCGVRLLSSCHWTEHCPIINHQFYSCKLKIHQNTLILLREFVFGHGYKKSILLTLPLRSDGIVIQSVVPVLLRVQGGGRGRGGRGGGRRGLASRRLQAQQTVDAIPIGGREMLLH